MFGVDINVVMAGRYSITRFCFREIESFFRKKKKKKKTQRSEKTTNKMK